MNNRRKKHVLQIRIKNLMCDLQYPHPTNKQSLKLAEGRRRTAYDNEEHEIKGDLT